MDARKNCTPHVGMIRASFTKSGAVLIQGGSLECIVVIRIIPIIPEPVQMKNVRSYMRRHRTDWRL